MDNYFDYNGWSFRRETDGSLVIDTSKVKGETAVFGEPKQTASPQMITIPEDQVHRLISYCLTGQVDNTQVLNSIKTLSREHTLVK